MPIVKPSVLPRWGEEVGSQLVSGPEELVPIATKLDVGWDPGEEPPAQYFNWWQRLVYDWIQFLDDFTNQDLLWPGLQTFSADNIHNGAEVHHGDEQHSGTETFTQPVVGSITGNAATATTATNATNANHATIADSATTAGTATTAANGNQGWVRVNSAGAVVRQNSGGAFVTGRTSTGHFVVNNPALTSASVILVSPSSTGGNPCCVANWEFVVSGQYAITIVNLSNALVDSDFVFTVIQL